MKPKSKHSRAARASKRDDHVRIKSKFVQATNVSTATLASNIGNIGTAVTTSILANDVGLQSLTDMFRLFRINSIRFEFTPATGVGTAAVEVPAGMLGFVPFGTAANPTSMSDFETPLISPRTVPFGTSVTTTPPLTRETGTHLTLKNSDMPVLQGPGGGWLATQDDGTQTSYGKLFWALASATAANTISYLLTTYFDISFKDLLDPTLISRNLLKYPCGFPPHWDISEACPLNALSRMMTVPRLLSQSSPGEQSTPGSFLVGASRQPLVADRVPPPEEPAKAPQLVLRPPY